MKTSLRRLRPSPVEGPGLAVCLLALALVAGGEAMGAGPARHPRIPAGPEECAGCHEALTRGRSVVHPVKDCRACHSVSRTGEDVAIALADTEPKLCGKCHAASKLGERHGAVLGEATHCSACHDPHGGERAKLMKGSRLHEPVARGACASCHRAGPGRGPELGIRGARLCLGCHVDLDGAGTAGSAHAALKDDANRRAGCLGCHEPHLSNERNLLRGSPAELCAGCHRALAEAGRSEPGCPLPRAECGICHFSHASSRKALLAVAPNQVCDGCHDPRGARLVKKHLKADLRKVECLSCHSSHGDCRPASLAKVVHPPVLDGCDSCHEGGEASKLTSGGGMDLCAACHDPVLQAAKKLAVRHPAMDAGSCRSCHAPHAAPRRWLMRSPPESACAPCHPAQVAGAREVAHGAIALLGCEACHEPHGSDNRKLLRRTGAELCMACHAPPPEGSAGGARTVFGKIEIPASESGRIRFLVLGSEGTRDHPTRGHLTVGTPSARELAASAPGFKGEIGCLSCHDPHKGATRSLLVGGATGAAESCLRCHRK